MDNIDVKKELVEKAQELVNKAENSPVYKEVADLRKRWKRASSEEESFLEKELSDKFEASLSKIKEMTGAVNESVEERKTAIINEAKELLNAKNFKQATAKMNELMDSWKQAGRAIKEKDDELWDEFKTVRDEFFEAKRNYITELKESFEKNKTAKEEIIKKAVEANTKDNFKEIGKTMDSLMEEWKKLGRASKEFEDDLWSKFNEQRKLFYKNRKEYFDSMKETFAARAEEKKEIIAEAKKYLARSEFSDDEINSVKGLREKWKAVGNAGKDNENSLWDEFNTVINKYYENMRVYKK